MNAQMIALVNQKVLSVDLDLLANLTISLGHPQPDCLSVMISDLMGRVLTDQPITLGEGILHHPEGFDLMPADIHFPAWRYPW